METTFLREKLHRFIDTVEDRKAEAIYTIFEDEIEQQTWEYSEEFKQELDDRTQYYENGGKMVSAEEAENQIEDLLRTLKGK